MSGIARLPGEVTVLEGPVAVAEAAADWIAGLSSSRVAGAGGFSIALSGGNTPRQLYQALAAAPRRELVDWERWSVYFSDERACPPDDPRSNFHLANQALLSAVAGSAIRVHRIEAERADLDVAAQEYASLMAATLDRGPQGAPRLDCILLGLGENGHTASLFPGTEALEVRDTWAWRGLADYEPYDRITMTFPAINAAAHVAFLVTGGGKGQALQGVVRGNVPAAGVRPLDGELRWFLDSAAAGSLDTEP